MARLEAGKRALARIQRLCCLGISGEVLVPDLLRELAALVPATQGVFYWVNSRREVVNVYTTISPNVMDLFLREFYLKSAQTSVIRTLANYNDWPATTPIQKLDDHLLVDRPAFVRSEFYNLLWRPAGIFESLMLCVRSAGRIVGLLQLYRAFGEKPFTSEEAAKLRALSGFIAHGVTATRATELAAISSTDRALFVADRNGIIKWANRQAMHLLSMAFNPVRSPAIHQRELSAPNPEIAQLWLALAQTARGAVGQPPPILCLRSAWGEFVLRAYWLEETDGEEPQDEICITIERRVPRVLALRREIEELPLTGREKQLCLLLATNRSRQEIADMMGLRISTIITHQRNVYSKLAVRSKAELITALDRGVSAA